MEWQLLDPAYDGFRAGLPQLAGVAIGGIACAYVGWSRVGKQIGDYRLVLVKSAASETK